MFISFDSIETGFEAQDRKEWARITRKLRQSVWDSKVLGGEEEEEEGDDDDEEEDEEEEEEDEEE